MVYGMVKQHNGHISVYSEPGKGTTFRIYFPAVISGDGEEVPACSSESLKGGTETILAADDDESLRQLSRTILETFGYRIITAEDGEDALNKFRENKDTIQLCVLDMMMPKKSGKEAYEEMREIRNDIKVLFLSGYSADVIFKKEILDQGFDFILKPVLPKDLLKKVRDILDK